VSKIHEYDLEIKPTTLIKWKGLAQMLMEGNERALNMNKKNSPKMVSVVIEELEGHEWYAYSVYYLKNLSCPNHLVDHKRRDLRLKASKYFVIQGGLGWRNPNRLILKYVDDVETKILMS
jgi:hypothetical protein